MRWTRWSGLLYVAFDSKLPMSGGQSFSPSRIWSCQLRLGLDSLAEFREMHGIRLGWFDAFGIEKFVP